MNITLEQLATLCEPEVEKDAIRNMIACPWQIEHDGAPWTIAVDGRLMLAVRGAFGADPLPERHAATIANLMGLSRGPTVGTVTVGEMRAWTGDADPYRKERCRDCDGTGECSHCREGTCPDCNGDGEYEVGPEPRYGVFFGAAFNKNLMARPLAMLPQELSLSVVPCPPAAEFEESKTLRLIGDGVLLLVAPIVMAANEKHDEFRPMALVE